MVFFLVITWTIQLDNSGSHLIRKDKDIAKKKYHLTARQAGCIANMACVKQFSVFHFSPRYRGMEHLLYEEAQGAYAKGDVI